MEIKTKLSIGDKMYMITKTEDNMIEVWGIFDDRRSDSVFVMYDRPVGKIHIEVERDNNVKIKYFPEGIDFYFYEEDVFGSIQEAQEECDKRNMRIKG